MDEPIILEQCGWLVFHEWNGETNKFFSFDKTNAENYAIAKHGYIEPVYRRMPLQQPEAKEANEQAT